MHNLIFNNRRGGRRAQTLMFHLSVIQSVKLISQNMVLALQLEVSCTLLHEFPAVLLTRLSFLRALFQSTPQIIQRVLNLLAIRYFGAARQNFRLRIHVFFAVTIAIPIQAGEDTACDCKTASAPLPSDCKGI